MLKLPNQTDHQCRYDALVARYENTKQRLAEIDVQITYRRAKHENVKVLMQMLRVQECLLTELVESLWHVTMDCLIELPWKTK